MKVINFVLLITAILAWSLSSCNSSTTNEQKNNNLVEYVTLDTIPIQVSPPTTSTAAIDNRLVEDTIKMELGEKLYFRGAAPKDSITVIQKHYNEYESRIYREYAFIVHNKKSIYHTSFTPQSLEKSYQESFKEEAEGSLWQNFEKHYNTAIENQKLKAEKISISEAINSYTGYWIYLDKYENKYFIDDQWSWLPSFRIDNDMLVRHYMDGPAPYIIEQFKVTESGDIQIKLVDEELQYYKLVDAKKRIYDVGHGRLIVPAKNANMFEIIEHANNTGDLI